MINLNFILIFSIFLLNGLVNCVYYNDTTHLIYSMNNIYVRNYYMPHYNETLQFLIKLSESNELNLNCRSSLSRLINGIEQNEFWAQKFLESTGKSVNGKLTGRNINFGSYDFCVNFQKDESKKVDFDGKYCLLSIQTPESDAIRKTDGYKKYQLKISERSRHLIDFNLGNAHGVCMPSTCRLHELIPVVNKIFKTYGLSILGPKSCTTYGEAEKLTYSQIVALFILSAFIFFCFLSIFFKNNFLKNFSIADNYNLANYYNPNFKLYFDGLKFFILVAGTITHSMILLGIFYTQPFAPVLESEITGFLSAFIKRFFKAVDVIFFYGAFFTMYAFHDLIKSGKMKYNLYTVFYTKYIRYSIILAIMILLTIILPQIGSGPYYSSYVNHISQNCQDYWWKPFLMISNTARMLDACILPSWHLSSEFQSNLFNYFTIYYMIKKPKLGFILLFLQFLGVSAFTYFYVKTYNIDTWQPVTDVEVHDLSVFEESYFPSFYYFNIYSLGLVCAWVVKNNMKPKIVDYKIFRIFVWLICALLGWFAFYHPNSYDIIGEKPSKEFQIIWFIFGFKYSITFFYFWLFYTLSFGYSRPLKYLLSFKFFIPWSRLSLSISLVQFIYLHYSLASTRTIFVFNRLFILKEVIATFFFTYVGGYAVFLLFEQPMNNLFKNYFGAKRRQDVKSDMDKKSKTN